MVGIRQAGPRDQIETETILLLLSHFLKKQSVVPAFAWALMAGLFGASSAAAIPMTLTWDSGALIDLENHGHPNTWAESNGIRSTAFWAGSVGTPSGYFTEYGHTHIDPNYSGRADGRTNRIHAATYDLQGIFISLESGASFDLVSIDYSITERNSVYPGQVRLDWAADPAHAQLLVSTSFDPTASNLESQWTQFALDEFGVPPVAYPYGNWFTRPLTGFDGVTGVFISTTAGLIEIDTLVIDVHTTSPIPEPSTAVLLGLGLMGIAVRRRSAS